MDYKNLPQTEQFVITTDLIGKEFKASFPQLKQIQKDGFIYQFALYDGDDECYYIGMSKSNSSFDPLDDYGMPNAGCTTIKYKNENGKYIDL